MIMIMIKYWEIFHALGFQGVATASADDQEQRDDDDGGLRPARLNDAGLAGAKKRRGLQTFLQAVSY